MSMPFDIMEAHGLGEVNIAIKFPRQQFLD